MDERENMQEQPAAQEPLAPSEPEPELEPEPVPEQEPVPEPEPEPVPEEMGEEARERRCRELERNYRLLDMKIKVLGWGSEPDLLDLERFLPEELTREERDG